MYQAGRQRPAVTAASGGAAGAAGAAGAGPGGGAGAPRSVAALSAVTTSRPTKAVELRMKVVQETLQRRQEEQARMELEEQQRAQKIKAASKVHKRATAAVGTTAFIFHCLRAPFLCNKILGNHVGRGSRGCGRVIF